MEDKKILLNHYDVLTAFHADYYKDLITQDHLGDETVIKVNEEQSFIFPVKYRGKLYAIPSEIVEKKKMPIKIMESEKLAYRSNVYHYVTKYASARIKPMKNLKFRTLIDTIGGFEHSNTDHFTLYKIACMMLYLRKGFARFVSEAAFGKNSVPTILKILMTDIAIINPRSTAAMEHKLLSSLLALDELTNLEKNQRDLMQEALLRIGDWSPSYEKGTRGSTKYGTKDEYNIGNLSVIIMYNILSYYQDIGQQEKYFDNIFQHAVKDRFLPLYLKGVIDTTQFKDIKDTKKVAKQLKNEIISIIRTIKYYNNNLENDLKDYKLYKDYRLSKSGRVDKTFQVICKGINLYANSEEEYNILVEQLYQMYLEYQDMLKVDEVEEVDLYGELDEENNKSS